MLPFMAALFMLMQLLPEYYFILLLFLFTCCYLSGFYLLIRFMDKKGRLFILSWLALPGFNVLGLILFVAWGLTFSPIRVPDLH